MHDSNAFAMNIYLKALAYHFIDGQEVLAQNACTHSSYDRMLRVMGGDFMHIEEKHISFFSFFILLALLLFTQMQL